MESNVKEILDNKIIENIKPINPIIKNIFLDIEPIFLLSIKIHTQPSIVKITKGKRMTGLLLCENCEEELKIVCEYKKRYISDNTNKIIPNANIIFFFNIIFVHL